MPIYEYECQACHHQLEVMQKMSEASLTDCPACESKSLQRLISAAGFQLKGTGWYATDFRHSGKAKVQPETTSSKDGASGKADTSSSSSSQTTSSADKTTGKSSTES